MFAIYKLGGCLNGSTHQKNDRVFLVGYRHKKRPVFLMLCLIIFERVQSECLDDKSSSIHLVHSSK